MGEVQLISIIVIVCTNVKTGVSYFKFELFFMIWFFYGYKITLFFRKIAEQGKLQWLLDILCYDQVKSEKNWLLNPTKQGNNIVIIMFFRNVWKKKKVRFCLHFEIKNEKWNH